MENKRPGRKTKSFDFSAYRNRNKETASRTTSGQSTHIEQINLKDVLSFAKRQDATSIQALLGGYATESISLFRDTVDRELQSRISSRATNRSKSTNSRPDKDSAAYKFILKIIDSSLSETSQNNHSTQAHSQANKPKPRKPYSKVDQIAGVVNSEVPKNQRITGRSNTKTMYQMNPNPNLGVMDQTIETKAFFVPLNLIRTEIQKLTPGNDLNGFDINNFLGGIKNLIRLRVNPSEIFRDSTGEAEDTGLGLRAALSRLNPHQLEAFTKLFEFSQTTKNKTYNDFLLSLRSTAEAIGKLSEPIKHLEGLNPLADVKKYNFDELAKIVNKLIDSGHDPDGLFEALNLPSIIQNLTDEQKFYIVKEKLKPLFGSEDPDQHYQEEKQAYEKAKSKGGAEVRSYSQNYFLALMRYTAHQSCNYNAAAVHDTYSQDNIPVVSDVQIDQGGANWDLSQGFILGGLDRGSSIAVPNQIKEETYIGSFANRKSALRDLVNPSFDSGNKESDGAKYASYLQTGRVFEDFGTEDIGDVEGYFMHSERQLSNSFAEEISHIFISQESYKSNLHTINQKIIQILRDLKQDGLLTSFENNAKKLEDTLSIFKKFPGGKNMMLAKDLNSIEAIERYKENSIQMIKSYDAYIRSFIESIKPQRQANPLVNKLFLMLATFTDLLNSDYQNIFAVNIEHLKLCKEYYDTDKEFRMYLPNQIKSDKLVKYNEALTEAVNKYNELINFSGEEEAKIEKFKSIIDRMKSIPNHIKTRQYLIAFHKELAYHKDKTAPYPDHDLNKLLNSIDLSQNLSSLKETILIPDFLDKILLNQEPRNLEGILLHNKVIDELSPIKIDVSRSLDFEKKAEQPTSIQQETHAQDTKKVLPKTIIKKKKKPRKKSMPVWQQVGLIFTGFTTLIGLGVSFSGGDDDNQNNTRRTQAKHSTENPGNKTSKNTEVKKPEKLSKEEREKKILLDFSKRLHSVIQKIAPNNRLKDEPIRVTNLTTTNGNKLLMFAFPYINNPRGASEMFATFTCSSIEELENWTKSDIKSLRSQGAIKANNGVLFADGDQSIFATHEMQTDRQGRKHKTLSLICIGNK